MEDIKSKIKAIENAIIKNKIKEALDSLWEIFTNYNATEEKHQTIQQINHLNRLKVEARDQTMTSENLDVQTNRIVKATLGLLSAAEKLATTPQQKEQPAWTTATYDEVKPVGDIFEQFKQKWNVNKQKTTNTPHGLSQTLYDQFLDNRNNWNIGTVHNQFNQYVGNIALLHQQCTISSSTNSNVNAWIPSSLNNFKEFTIETQVRFKAGDNFGFGLIWGANPANFDSYYFLISQVGQFCIGYQMNGASINLANWMFSPYIWQGVNLNKLKLHRVGDQVYFYINDQHIFTTTYYTFFGNYLGMTAINYKTVSFDYIQVWN